eukprot:scaffold15486_cov53-Attheya_sp.AAC.5
MHIVSYLRGISSDHRAIHNPCHFHHSARGLAKCRDSTSHVWLADEMILPPWNGDMPIDATMT